MKAFVPILIGFASLPLLWLSGCSGGYKVKVDALAKPNAANSISYRIQATGASKTASTAKRPAAPTKA